MVDFGIQQCVQRLFDGRPNHFVQMRLNASFVDLHLLSHKRPILTSSNRQFFTWRLAFGFRDTSPYTALGPFSVSGGDLNSDGNTDLFGVDAAAGQLAVFYGDAGDTFASYFMVVPPGTFGGTSAGGYQTAADSTNSPFNPQLARLQCGPEDGPCRI